MKRFQLTIIMVVIGLAAFSQSPSRFINLRPSYPVVIGEKTADGVKLSNNGLYMYDILQDSLPQYEIGHIFAQTVRYTEEGHGFYIKSDSLHSHNVVYRYEVDEQPHGTIEFNSSTGRFKFYPAVDDYKSFNVTFSATSGGESVSEKVEFTLRPETAPETFAFQTEGVMPSEKDYTIIAETTEKMLLNNEERTAYSISISGKEVVFDNTVHNKVYGLSGREDIYELNVFAERLIIRSPLSFPHTNVTIYAKELIFEDQDGVISSINTTPSPIGNLIDKKGKDGENAGDIAIYVKEVKGNPAKRLILNGGKGQSTNRDGTPGNGGNGGTVVSTIDVSNYCDFARGSSGVRYDVAEGGNHEAGSVIASGTIGSIGHFELTEEPYAYLHPYYIAAVLRHANDAFINNKIDYTMQVCKEYQGLIEEYMSSPEWKQCGIENGAKLKNDLTEIESMMYRMEQGLDYFGNPVGWVPLLSFEVMLTNFDNEIDRAIPTLYMSYWLNHIDQTLEKQIAANLVSVSETEKKIQDFQTSINSWVLEIPEAKDKCAELEVRINNLTQQAEAIRNHLYSKYKRNLKKKNRIGKAFNICKSVISCIPVYGQVASTALNVASSVANKVKEFKDYDDYGFISTFSNFQSVDYDSILKSLTTAKDTLNWKSLGSNPKLLQESYNSIDKATSPLISNLNTLYQNIFHGSIPKDKVDEEFKKLLEESPEYQSLQAKIKESTNEKADLESRITKLGNDILATVTQIGKSVVALDDLKRDVFTGNSKRDLNAKLYMEEMVQNARNRLLKYHYYLRKAYEYRLLRPYEGEFNLVSMFDKFESLGMALGDVIDEDAYSSLGSIFREIVSDMAEKIIDEYSANYPEQSAPITIVISKEQLDVINSDENLALNFHEMGIFASDEENVRIVNLGIQHIETHVEGKVGYSGYMDLNMTHSGISLYRKDGQLYWFDHKSRTTTNPHTWGIRYDAVSKENTTIQPSAASASLIASLIGNGNNVMLFSRPSAWSDVNLSKKVHTSGGGNIIIDSLVLKLQYDFTRRPNNIRNIDITANDELLPYIACSEEDINGRSNGNGNLYRSYNLSNQPVTFSAIEKYGTYHFVNWTDRSGKIVSQKKDLTVNRSNDQFYIANYERRIPILHVLDTIQVSHDGGVYRVHVGNVGSGDIEMDWYVDDSISTWVHLNGIAEGIDDGDFTFAFDANPSKSYRLDSLEIFVPETDEMSKIIYIAQVDHPSSVEEIDSDETNIKVRLNSMDGKISVEGDEMLSVIIYSTSGNELYRLGLGGKHSATIDMGNLPRGVYIISIKTNKGIINKKILKTG